MDLISGIIGSAIILDTYNLLNNQGKKVALC